MSVDPVGPTARLPPPEWVDDTTLRVDGTAYTVMYGPRHDDALVLFKPRPLIEAYEPLIEEFQGSIIVELGIFAGGSTAYLAQRCAPRRLVALDRSPERVAALDRFLAREGLEGTVALHYGLDQQDRGALAAVVDAELGDEPIDLVIDDASHRYAPTVASFEVLFPRLRHGGLYVVEDWNADDWLVRIMRDAFESQDPMALAMVERRLADELGDPEAAATPSVAAWCTTVLTDPGHRDHLALTAWRARLHEPGATDDQVEVAARLDALVAAHRSGRTTVPPPTLGTMAIELLLAIKAVNAPLMALTVTPWWFAVRRGGLPGLTDFSIQGFGRDQLDVLASYLTRAPGT